MRRRNCRPCGATDRPPAVKMCRATDHNQLNGGWAAGLLAPFRCISLVGSRQKNRAAGSRKRTDTHFYEDGSSRRKCWCPECQVSINNSRRAKLSAHTPLDCYVLATPHWSPRGGARAHGRRPLSAAPSQRVRDKNSSQWTCVLSQSELRRDGPPPILWGRIGCNTPDKDIRDLYAFF